VLTDRDDGEAGGPSRQYALRRCEPTPYGIRRIALGRLEHAVEQLRDRGADPAEAVHEARKDMKKLRSVLRLVRPVLGEREYERHNARFRDAARLLSGVRDAQVLGETVGALAERFAEDPPPGGWQGLTAAVGGHARPAGLDELREEAALEIDGGRQALMGMALDAEGADLLRPGLRRSYARGRRRFRDAAAEPTDERLHQWRKGAKDLWYQLRLVRPGWEAALGPLTDEAHELSDLLGDDHDLALLRGELERASVGAVERRHLARLVVTRRGELQARAFAAGELLYAEKPKAFADRIAAYWAAP
jgi:CHAD domain-containing protein